MSGVVRLPTCDPGLLAAASAAHGAAQPVRPCRGWGLAARGNGLTDAEHDAGAAHLALCRRCREGLATLERTRAQLLGGSVGVGTGMAATSLLTSGSSSLVGAAGSVIATKAGAGLVAALAGAVLVTGGTAAVVQQPRNDAGWRPAPVSSPGTCASCPPAPGPTATDSPSRPGVSVPVAVAPAPLPTDLPTGGLSTGGLPTDVPLDVPILPVPLPTLPIPVPSVPPLPLPEPLPSVLAPLLDPS